MRNIRRASELRSPTGTPCWVGVVAFVLRPRSAFRVANDSVTQGGFSARGSPRGTIDNNEGPFERAVHYVTAGCFDVTEAPL